MLKKKLKGLNDKKPPKSKKQTKSFLAECKGKTCFAFDFGEYATKIAVGKIAKGKIEIRDILVVENDERTAKVDESSMKELFSRISRALAQHNLSTSGQIGMCTVGNRQYISRQFDIPYAEEHDRQGLVAYEMSQSLFLDIDSYFFQHKVLRVFEKDSVKMCTVWAVAVPQTLCNSYYKLLELLKLRPLVMDLNVNGMERFLNTDHALASCAHNSTLAVIDYGMRGTEIEIYEKGQHQEGFHIDIGDGRLVVAAKGVLGVQVADIHNSNKLVVPPQSVYEILKAAQTSQTARGFRSAVEEWLTEINTVIKRYNINHPGQPVSMLFLSGGSPQFPWLKVYLEKHLGIPVNIISTLDCVAFSSKARLSGNPVPQCINALGLFLIQ